MLTRRADDPEAVLTTYRAILRSRPPAGEQARLPIERLWVTALDFFDGRLPVRDDGQSPVKTLLKLSGAVRVERSRLVVRNPIYRAVFDERWVKEQLERQPTYWTRRLQRTMSWLTVVLLLLLFPATVFAGTQWMQAEAARGLAVSAQQTAVRAERLAVAASQLQEQQRRVAEAGALALQAQVIYSQNRRRGLSLLLAAAQRARTPQVDQVLRRVLAPSPCFNLGRRVYGAIWPANDQPRVLIDDGDLTLVRAWDARDLLTSVPRSVQGDGRGALLSGDGRYLLLARGAPAARVLDAQSGALLFELPGSGGAIRRAEWSPDRRALLTLDGSPTVRAWSATSGAELRSFSGRGARLISAAWSPDSQLIAAGDAAGGVRVWSVHSGETLAVLQGHAGAVAALAWSADGARLASAGLDGVVRIWDVKRAAELAPALDAHDGPLLGVRWSADAQQIMTLDGGAVRIWSVNSRAQLSVLNVKSAVSAFLWSADERQVLIASRNGRVCTYDTFDRLLERVRQRGVAPLAPEEAQAMLAQLLPELAPPGEPAPTRLPATDPAPTADSLATTSAGPAEEFSSQIPAETPSETPSETPTETPTDRHSNKPADATSTPAVTATETSTPADTATETFTPAVIATETATAKPTDVLVETATPIATTPALQTATADSSATATTP